MERPTVCVPEAPVEPTSPGRPGPAVVGTSSSTACEMPKSVSAGQPYALVSTLAGLMSRWRMPAAWAVATALARRTPVRSASATANRRSFACSARLGPAQYSIARYGRPSGATSAV